MWDQKNKAALAESFLDTLVRKVTDVETDEHYRKFGENPITEILYSLVEDKLKSIAIEIVIKPNPID